MAATLCLIQAGKFIALAQATVTLFVFAEPQGRIVTVILRSPVWAAESRQPRYRHPDGLAAASA